MRIAYALALALALLWKFPQLSFKAAVPFPSLQIHFYPMTSNQLTLPSSLARTTKKYATQFWPSLSKLKTWRMSNFICSNSWHTHTGWEWEREERESEKTK